MGVVQGLTEFLPISSSGHLVVAEAAVGLTTPGVTVEVALHVATLLAVVIVYRERLLQLLLGAARGDRVEWGYVVLIAVGSVPAGLAGFFFADFFKGAFDSLLAVGANFMITGTILWTTRWGGQGAGGAGRKVQEAGRGAQDAAAAQLPSAWGALGIGLAQALAIFPGISRSGTTVSAGLWLRIDPVKAAEFSFILAIPAIAGAALLQVADLNADLSAVGEGPLLASFMAALVSGVAAIRILVALLRRHHFHRFAPYCWSIGLVTIVWAVAR